MVDLDQGDLLSMKRRMFWLVVLVVAGWAAAYVHARVFKIAGISIGGGSFDFSAMGKLLYRGSMEVDGQSADVSVFRAEGGGGQLAGLIRGAAGPARYAGGAGMGLGEIRDGGQRVRLLSLPVDGDGGSLVVAVQAPDAKSGTGTLRNTIIDGVPVYHGAVIKRVMRNADTATTLRQATTTDAPGMVMEFYRAALASQGWKPALPGVASTTASELVCYVRGADLCWILCRRVESDGETRLTLVNKRGVLNATTGDR